MDIGKLVAVIGCLLVFRGVQGSPACDSEVYCDGDLLNTTQTSGIFTDSKEFVDRPLKDDPATVLEAFRNLPDYSNASLLQFVEQWTENVTADFVPWEPPDWVERPAFIDSIKDSQLQKWALDLNTLWKTFGKEVNSSVSVDQQDRHSLILVPHPYISPGAGSRFREFYYWDSYWILEGILLCGMDRTAQKMIENLAEMVRRYGLVPNGGRVYYTRRSQPPLLTQMVNLYYNVTANKTFLEEMLPYLDDEYHFWMENRTVNVTSFLLNRYAAELTDPRPESYREDLETAMDVSDDDRPELYSNIASAAESGWDFSSRWFNQSGELSSIRTKRIVPVDLNAILCENEATLARLHEIVGNSTAAKDYTERAKKRRDAMEAVFWNETEGLWLDWDLDTMEHLDGFYASSLVPLYWGCGPTNLTRHQRVQSRLQQLGVLDYPGGIPTSLNMKSTQQWDFPNAWAPLQWFPVLAWHDSTDETLRETARAIAKTWITSTFSGWEKYNMTMFEKYDCTVAGMPGRGGEYAVQSGFGWTNGVVLHFLSLYPDTLSETHSSSQSLGWVAAVVLFVAAIAVIIACVLWGRWIYLSGHKKYWARVQSEHLIAAGGAATTPPTSPIVYTNKYTDPNGNLDNAAKQFQYDT